MQDWELGAVYHCSLAGPLFLLCGDGMGRCGTSDRVIRLIGTVRRCVAAKMDRRRRQDLKIAPLAEMRCRDGKAICV